MPMDDLENIHPPRHYCPVLLYNGYKPGPLGRGLLITKLAL